MQRELLKSATHRIQGERLYLRDVCSEDVSDRYVAWLADPEVTQYLETRHSPQTKESIIAYVRQFRGDPDNLFLAIILDGSEQHIGNIKLGPINWIHRFADVSLFLGEKSCWGKGYATEAIRILVRHAFDALKLNRLQATIYGANTGSIRAFLKVGFQEEGTLRKKRFTSGAYMDEKLLAIINPVS